LFLDEFPEIIHRLENAGVEYVRHEWGKFNKRHGSHAGGHSLKTIVVRDFWHFGYCPTLPPLKWQWLKTIRYKIMTRKLQK